MLDLYYWATPNGHKITVFLEESGLPYQLHPINIGKGEQFAEAYLKISPNNKIPAIQDWEPRDGHEPITLFESGAILEYLAEKTGQFLPTDQRKRFEVLAWLHWQIGGLGPMAGQNHHFTQYASERVPYAIDRYVKETARLYSVLNKQLSGRVFVAGDDYSIADMAIYPWVRAWERQSIDLDSYPNVQRWFQQLSDRPAVRRAYVLAAKLVESPQSVLTRAERNLVLSAHAL